MDKSEQLDLLAQYVDEAIEATSDGASSCYNHTWAGYSFALLKPKRREWLLATLGNMMTKQRVAAYRGETRDTDDGGLSALLEEWWSD